jgi:mannosyltransferase OCH1-like enzyme
VIHNKDIVKKINYGSSIPKIIHQTYGKREILPPEINSTIMELKKLNPEWEYRFYDDEDMKKYIILYFPEVLPFFLAINPKYGAAKADLFRYLLIYNEGGVYIDIKSTFIKPLNSVVRKEDSYLLSRWYNGKSGIHPEIDSTLGEFQQCFIIARKGHPFLKSVIDTVLRNIAIYQFDMHFYGKYGTLRVTGPIAYTLAIDPLLCRYSYRFVKSKDELGYVYSIYEEVGKKSHKNILLNHYASQKEPIIEWAGDMIEPVQNSMKG